MWDPALDSRGCATRASESWTLGGVRLGRCRRRLGIEGASPCATRSSGTPIAGPVLALTCWDDTFALHELQPLPIRPPRGPLSGMRDVELVTDVGSKHHSPGSGGHGHPRFLWHMTFEPALPARVRTLTLSAMVAPGAATVTVLIRLPRWPPSRCEAVARTATGPMRPRPHLERAGSALPDRVVALSADLGVAADVRRALTMLYCWPSWFLLTVEAPGGPLPVTQRTAVDHAWEMEDDRGNTYAGMDTGGLERAGQRRPHRIRARARSPGPRAPTVLPRSLRSRRTPHGRRRRARQRHMTRTGPSVQARVRRPAATLRGARPSPGGHRRSHVRPVPAPPPGQACRPASMRDVGTRRCPRRVVDGPVGGCTIRLSRWPRG